MTAHDKLWATWCVRAVKHFIQLIWEHADDVDLKNRATAVEHEVQDLEEWLANE